MSEELVKFEHVWEDTAEKKKDKWGKGHGGIRWGKGQAGKRTSWEEEKWWKCTGGGGTSGEKDKCG